MNRVHGGIAVLAAAFVVAFQGVDGVAHPGTGGVTWTGSVARILERRCSSCHGASGVAQPSLRNYPEASAAAQAIKDAVLARRMPRWHAAHGFGDFRNDPSLTPHEIDLIAEWADAGAPKGAAAMAPPLQAMPPAAGEPDLVLTVASKHRIRAPSHTFTLKTGLDSDSWLRGWEFRPGNPARVRSAVISVAGETLATWVPGDAPTFLPDGVGQRLRAGATLEMTVHYRANAAPAVDASSVALFFGSRPERELKQRMLACGSTTLTHAIEALAIRPGVGSSGQWLRVVASLPTRRIEPVGWFHDYTRDHAQTYWFRAPLRLPAKTSLEVAAADECGAELTYIAERRGRVTDAAPVPARELAPASEYWCPMHANERSAGPGVCGLCRMSLVPTVAQIEGRYAVGVEVERGASPKLATLRLTVREPETDAVVRRFEQVHDRRFHLFVVSDDLNEFSHVHPEAQPDGSLEVPVPLGASGAYHLFADFLPVGGTPQLVRNTVLTRIGRPPARGRLVPDHATKTGRQLRVRIEPASGELRAGVPTFLAFVLEDPQSGMPITDLEPYLGAWGHMFIVSEDLADAVHSHPVTPLSSTGGPEIMFRQRFPRSGIYRLWVQFQRGGEVETVPFTVAVNGPPRSPATLTAPVQ